MAETILTSANPSDASPLDPPSRVVCLVCQRQWSQYTCPRCNTRYCSLQCYKSHSERCTESFMRENVLEEMQHMQADEETKRRTLEMLKRFHSEEEESDGMDEDDDSFLSEETVKKVLSGGEISFDELLSAEEKKQFRRAVASGQLGRLIEPWEPWWLKPLAKTISLGKDGTQLVQPICGQDMPSSSNCEVGVQTSEIPAGPPTPLPMVRKLASTEPSPLLAIHLLDILYSYCFTLRIYNGDWSSDAVGSAMVVVNISSVLGQAGQPETVMESLSYSLAQTCSPDFKHMGGLQFGLRIVDDVVHLLSLGSAALICSLCDLQRLVQAGERDLKAEKPKTSRGSEIRNKMKLADRKIYFMMCWVHEQPGEVWGSLAALVEVERRSLTDSLMSKTAENKVETKGKVIIQELK